MERLDIAGDARRILAALLDGSAALTGPGRTVVVATHDPVDHLPCRRLALADG